MALVILSNSVRMSAFGGIIGLDRKLARLEIGCREMLAIGQRLPVQEILRAFRHVRNHLQQHDGFVEVIQIIGGKAGAGIDVGGPQLRGPRLVAGPATRRLAIGSRGFGAVEVIGRSVNVRG